jgi:hypothetical protein
MNNETTGVRSTELKKDEFAYNALPAIMGYKPANELCTVESVNGLYQQMKSMQQLKVQKEGEFKSACDAASQAERSFHDVILQVKNQVRAQFGDNSNELQSLGLKKKSERKAPKRKPKVVEQA